VGKTWENLEATNGSSSFFHHFSIIFPSFFHHFSIIFPISLPISFAIWMPQFRHTLIFCADLGSETFTWLAIAPNGDGALSMP